jgi:hypothetical protein
MEETHMMKHLSALTLAALVALPAYAQHPHGTTKPGVTITGYIDIGYIAAENPQLPPGLASGRMQASGSTNGTWNGNDGFTLNDVNIDMNALFTEDIKGYISFNFANGAAPLVDFAEIDFYDLGMFKNKVAIGRIGSVVGIEQRVSESNLNKFINMTLISPWTVGSQDGIAVYGDVSMISYSFALTNGDNIGSAPAGGVLSGASMGTAPRNPVIGGAVGAALDNNNNFALSGRIGAKPIDGLEIGVSASTDKYVTAAGAAASTNLDAARNQLGVDASYIWGALTLKGEYINVNEDVVVPALGFADEVRVNGYYFEGWYDLNSKVGLGVRYNRVKSEQPQTGGTQPGAVVSDYSTVAFAGLYRVAENVQLKAEYDLNQEKTVSRVVIPSATHANKFANNVFALSLVGAF